MWKDFNWSERLVFYLTRIFSIFDFISNHLNYHISIKQINLKYFCILNILSRSKNSSLSPFECIYRLTPILQNIHMNYVNVSISDKYKLKIIIEQILPRVRTKPWGDPITRSCCWHLSAPFTWNVSLPLPLSTCL